MGTRAWHGFAVIDASYARYRSHQDWAAAVVSELQPIADLGMGLGLSIIRAPARQEEGRAFLAHESLGPVRESGAFDALRSIIAAMDTRSFTAAFEGPRVFMSSTRTGRFSADGSAAHAGALRRFDAADFLGVIGRPAPDLVCAIIAACKTTTPLSGRTKQLLRQVLVHVEMAARIRLTEARPVAVLNRSGAVLEASPELQTAVQGRAFIPAVEKLMREATQQEGSLVAWNALVAGRLKLVPFVDTDGKRLLHVYESASDARALSQTERSVLEHAIRGTSGKQIGLSLGLADSKVSDALQKATLKLGLRNRAQLVALAAALMRPERKRVRLSRAEQHVLDGIGRGLRNCDIARERNTSERTVANQVASLLRKVAAPNRRALLALAPRDSAGDAPR